MRRLRTGRIAAYFAIAGATVGALALAAFAAPNPRFADKSPQAIPVDVELVIAVDVSYSMDPEEQALQREGYVQALTSREFMSALREGANGKIAITYFEWAGQSDQKIIMPWRLIEGPESADAVASEIASAPYRRAGNFGCDCIGRFRAFDKPPRHDDFLVGLSRPFEVGDGDLAVGALAQRTHEFA